MAFITVDFDDTVGYISRRIFGVGLEHVGANVYGGLWVGPQSESRSTPVPTTHQGWREDVLALARRLRPTMLHWPGGNFAQFYHWRDGVGPRADRPLRFDYFWGKPEPNAIGTDEFLDLCALIDAEPSITVNTRTGTPAEAAAWVEYCNGSLDSPGGQLRAANGHPKPYGVRLWSVGSQTWEMGPEEAIKRHLAFSAAMTAVDPEIQVVAIGGNPSNQESWDPKVVENARAYLNVVGVWAYDGVADVESGDPVDLHYANVASAERLLWTIANTVQTVDSQLGNRPDVGVGFDSWGVWRSSRQGLQHDYHLGDALVAATVFNGLYRLHHRVRCASWGNLVNALGLIQATERNSWATPVFEVFRMYSLYHGGEVVRSSVAGPTMDAPGGTAPVRAPRPLQSDMALLDIAATRDRRAGRYAMSVVNRSYSASIDVDLQITGLPPGLGATAYALTGDDAFSTNTPDAPRRVSVNEIPLGQVGTTFSFHPRSVTVMVWEETPGLS